MKPNPTAALKQYDVPVRVIPPGVCGDDLSRVPPVRLVPPPGAGHRTTKRERLDRDRAKSTTTREGSVSTTGTKGKKRPCGCAAVGVHLNTCSLFKAPRALGRAVAANIKGRSEAQTVEIVLPAMKLRLEIRAELTPR